MPTNRSARAPDPLLADIGDERERRARRRLLRDLRDAGVSEPALRRAAERDHLALVSTELALVGRDRFSFEALERRFDLPEGLLRDHTRASGLPVPERATDVDARAARRLRALLDLGLPRDALLDMARIAGQGMATNARAIEASIGQLLLRAGDTEVEVSRRYAEAATEMTPHFTALLDIVFRLHLRQSLRTQTLGRDERLSGRLATSRPMAVAFADLVGFTRMGSRVHADEVGRVASRLVSLTLDLVSPPVSLVKSIGDAVFLVSPKPSELIAVLLELVAAVEAEGRDFPELRAGAALGPAVPLGGDWYGPAVNVASRVAEVAHSGTVLVTRELRAEARQDFGWRRTIPRHLKGVPGTLTLFRARPLSA